MRVSWKWEHFLPTVLLPGFFLYFRVGSLVLGIRCKTEEMVLAMEGWCEELFGSISQVRCMLKFLLREIFF